MAQENRKSHNFGYKGRPSCVLIVRFSALGDVAMSIPVVYSVCLANPATRFIYLTRKGVTGMFINTPSNLEVLGIDLDDYRGMGGLWRLFREITRRYDIDAIADIHDVLRSKMLYIFGCLKGIRIVSINKGRQHKRALTRRRNKVMLPLISQRARYREVFFRMGLVVEERFKSLFGDGKGDAHLFAEVAPEKKTGERWVGIAPFAKHRGKIYPPSLMEKVLKSVVADDRNRVFLFGGGDYEREILHGWAEAYPRVISMADKRHGFETELSLMSHFDVMISMDSANMHLASLVSVPVISVWGATHPYCGFKGWRQRSSTIVQLTMTCRPCSVFGNKPCLRGDYQCLAGIPPQLIVDKLNQVLNQVNE